MESTTMTFKNDIIFQLAAFVIIGFIVSVFAFADNTKSPLHFDDQPQSFFINQD
jgi:hypothetical protein